MVSRIPPDVVAAVAERADGMCEMGRDCRDPGSQSWAFHHRRAYQTGATSRARTVALNVPENLLLLHTRCHEWVHQHPLWARERGYIVSQYNPL